MKPQQIEKWEQTRKMGAWKYGLIYGTIWGLLVVAFVIIVNSFFKFDPRMLTTKGIGSMIVIYWIAGVFLYRFVFWRAKEKLYQAWKEKK